MANCSKCGRSRDYAGECMYCWGREAGNDVNAGKTIRLPNSDSRRDINTGQTYHPKSSGCLVLAVLALSLSGLIPGVLLMWHLAI